MTTIINSNGGGRTLPIEALFDRLASDPLDRTFERYGNFVSLDPEGFDGKAAFVPGTVHFFGNFQTYSHVFSITTDEAALADRLTAAIRENQQRADYLAQPDVEAQLVAIEERNAENFRRMRR
jgi:hypothetical protein